MTPERIRALLAAAPFIPFTAHLADRHSVHVGDPANAWLEEDGRVLIVQTLVRRDAFLETLETAAIVRLSTRAPSSADTLAAEQRALISQPEETTAPHPTRVLFICTRNSVRSQMAEAWSNHLGGEQMAAESAGFEPGDLHPLAIEAMREVGIDISEQKTKSIFELYREGALFAFTICVCDESAEKAPIFPGQAERLHWSIPDPLAGDAGSDADVLRRMRAARDALRERIEAWLRKTTTPGRH